MDPSGKLKWLVGKKARKNTKEFFGKEHFSEDRGIHYSVGQLTSTVKQSAHITTEKHNPKASFRCDY